MRFKIPALSQPDTTVAVRAPCADAQLRGIFVRGGMWQEIATVIDQIHFPLPGSSLRDGDVSFDFSRNSDLPWSMAGTTIDKVCTM